MAKLFFTTCELHVCYRQCWKHCMLQPRGCLVFICCKTASVYYLVEKKKYSNQCITVRALAWYAVCLRKSLIFWLQKIIIKKVWTNLQIHVVRWQLLWVAWQSSFCVMLSLYFCYTVCVCLGQKYDELNRKMAILLWSRTTFCTSPSWHPLWKHGPKSTKEECQLKQSSHFAVETPPCEIWPPTCWKAIRSPSHTQMFASAGNAHRVHTSGFFLHGCGKILRTTSHHIQIILTVSIWDTDAGCWRECNVW